jgi:alpha-L-fucosidase
MMKKYIWAMAALLFGSLTLSAQTPAGDEDKEMFNRGRARDQQALDEAQQTWWPQSMKTHDARIQWWRDARFGMFVHWGVYSLPGGEWKGQRVNGYAEHLMRKEKITRAEYLELAGRFNPVRFNADEWIRQAKGAGMRYFVITAKHHDGFAMFDSKVSDFDIVDRTPFRRDPMAELAAAAHKQGMRFGFYYSHAFDWEHPDAPGNDWEYNNPGGDKNLHGGREWYDLHPDMLEKARRYVDQKVIPQLRELLTKYHPDILWFDTPQKLPLSENIRILKAIRAIDPNVVVNGRLVRTAGANLGDYRNTADRPAEFYPVEGDWEAIPTTNESYGYHKFDNSHKPAGHFVRLLANAASRGGNLLMNIGPKGDGSFDEKDQRILAGIGSWLKRNGESIYGTQKSRIAPQSWGVSTSRGNRIYLHVFQWPRNGRLEVGGLRTMPSRISLLADPKKTFTSRTTANGLSIALPALPIDSINTVLVLDFKTSPIADSIRYVSPDVPHTQLLAFDAEQQGKGFSFGDGKSDRYYVEGWKSKEQSLSWSFRTPAAGNYRLRIRYLAPGESSGGTYALTSGDFYLQQPVLTAKGQAPVTQELGYLWLKSGLNRIELKAVNIGGSELMKPLELQLEPAAEAFSLSKVFADAEAQTHVMLDEIPKARAARSTLTTGGTPGSAGNDLVSPRTLDSGRLRLVTARDWTSGFFPGVLWQLYDYTRKSEWKAAAETFTAPIEKEKTNGTTHDMGFKVYCSFGTGFALTGDAHYKDVILQSARTLSTRFNKTTGVIRSWDHSKQKWDFPVIIDNMMNLELLFAATRLSGDSTFYRIAVSHADNTMKNHFRPDYSSYHVVDYDSTAFGRINKKTTHQGYADASAWSRGQGWGLYGYTMCYRETHDPRYLKQAEGIASFILSHPNMPADGVPYWDFNAPAIPAEPRDASAAAVIASGLYELSTYSSAGKKYRAAADKIVEHLSRSYRAPIGTAEGFLLLHSTGSKPSNSEVDVPLNYADYYYLEALLRMKKLRAGKKLFN